MTMNDIREIVEDSPFFEKWGEEEDAAIILKRVRKYLDPFDTRNTDEKDRVGEVYAG